MQAKSSNSQSRVPLTSENPFAAAGTWYRGNTHTHSVASDGKMTVIELAEWYEQQGYDFLCITDHGLVADLDQSASSSIVLIPGAEIVFQSDQAIGGEICALGIEEVRRESVPAQLIIEDVLVQGGLPFMNHPHQSGVSSELMMEMKGLLGIEVFNASYYGMGQRGFSLTQWDELLSAGKRTLGIAADDRHTANDDSPYNPSGFDRAKGWVMVRARDRTVQGLVDAMAKGMFYSATGPKIHDIQVTANEIVVCTSPVKSIRFATIPWCGTEAVAKDGEMLTQARIPLDSVGTPDRCGQVVDFFVEKGLLTKPAELGAYFRVECWDGQEGWAWSNPIYFESL